jgi:hypothetical protein
MPGSGAAETLLAAASIDAAHIISAVQRLVGNAVAVAPDG